MRFYFLLILFQLNVSAFSQCLGFQFAEIGYEPANCRTASYQTGNGVVYAAATGGTEPYSYQWTNLQTGQTTNNTTWGGLNVGFYEIYAHDSLGCILMDTLEVDSANVISAFEIISSDFDSTGIFAFLPFQGDVKIEAVPCYYAQPFPEEFDTNFMWQFGAGAAWEMGWCWEPRPFELTTEGDFEITLVAINKNGCTDTLTKILNAVLPTYAPIYPTVFSDYATGEVFVEMPEDLNAVFVVYDLSGTVQAKINLEPGLNTINIKTGISFYKIVSASSSEEIMQGKLISTAP